MVAQVLAKESFDEERILRKLLRYRKPVKTKHLAHNLKCDRVDLTRHLNNLKSKGLIQYTSIPEDNDDRRGKTNITYGWIIR